MNKKVLLIIVSILAIIAFVINLYISIDRQESTTVQGTSMIPDLDVVSGEILPKDIENVTNYLSNLAGKDIKPDDIKIRQGTYQKKHAKQNLGYSITFTVDIESVKSSYDLDIQYVKGQSLGVFATCASNQSAGFQCVDKTIIQESA